MPDTAAGELAHLQEHEACAQHESDREPQQYGAAIARLHLQAGEAEGHAGNQQQRRLDGRVVEVEQILARGAAGGTGDHDGVGREQQGEDHGIAHQVKPETQRPLLVGLDLFPLVLTHVGDAHARLPSCR